MRCPRRRAQSARTSRRPPAARCAQGGVRAGARGARAVLVVHCMWQVATPCCYSLSPCDGAPTHGFPCISVAPSHLQATPGGQYSRLPRHPTACPAHALALPQRTKKIFVGGLAASVDEDTFRAYFEEFGAVSAAGSAAAEWVERMDGLSVLAGLASSWCHAQCCRPQVGVPHDVADPKWML